MIPVQVLRRGILCRIGSRRHSKRATRSGASWRRIEGTQDVSMLHASCFKSTNSMTQRRRTEYIGRRQDPRHRRRSSPPRSYLQSLRCDICLIQDGQQRTLLMIVAFSSLHSGRLIQTPSDAKGLRQQTSRFSGTATMPRRDTEAVRGVQDQDREPARPLRD